MGLTSVITLNGQTFQFALARALMRIAIYYFVLTCQSPQADVRGTHELKTSCDKFLKGSTVKRVDVN